MTLNWDLVGPISIGIVQLVALIKAYYGLKADNAKVCSDIALAMLSERAERVADNAKTRSEFSTLLKAAELCISDLTRRVTSIEGTNLEWTREFRQRTHDLSNSVHALTMKVDRLERPHRKTDDVELHEQN